MEIFDDYLKRIDHPQIRACIEEVLGWVNKKYPSLEPKVAWNQPMFTDHDTFIIGFSVSKNHLAIAPEKAAIDQFSSAIIEAGFEHTMGLIRMPWNSPIDYSLLEKIIAFNILDKADCATFWRK